MVHLRPAAEGDLPALIALARRSWLGAFADAPAAFVRDWLARDFEFYLARDYRHARSETKDRAGGVVEEMLYFNHTIDTLS